MHPLDSASLRYGDCFLLQIVAPGRHAYAIVPAHAPHLALRHPFEIEVARGKSAKPSRQVNIAVGFREGALVATPATVTVAPGTMLCWSPENMDVPGFAIVAADGSFASDPISAPAIFSHRFLEAGDYRWIDRHGGDVSGRIQVTAPDPRDRRALDKWQGQVRQAVTIAVPNGLNKNYRAVVGQPVLFLIEKMSGISITDERWAQMDDSAQRRADGMPRP